MTSSRVPVVGISTYVEPATWGAWRDVPAALLPLGYVRHVRDAGALPVLLPPLAPSTSDASDDGRAETLLDRLDGLLLAGGADIEPARYGSAPHPSVQAPRPDRDSTELALARQSAARDLPVLGICRGMQVLCVEAGAGLDQHLPDRVGHDGHAPGPGRYGEHAVRTVPGTRLAAVLGEQVTVPSYHHQAPAAESIGSPGLVASAWSDDGVMEAVEDPDARFRVGVLWHPEVGDDPRLFEALVASSRL